MSSNAYILEFEKLCEYLDIGTVIKKPEELTGGLLHRMFKIETTESTYAIKALNPEVMSRPTAYNNIAQAEKVAQEASNYLPAHAAITFNGEHIHKLGTQFYMVFHWLDGITKKEGAVTINDCITIGGCLADIHNVDFQSIPMDKCCNTSNSDTWESYLHHKNMFKQKWSREFSSYVKELEDYESKSLKAIAALSDEQIISHRDLDPKNIMWCNESPIIIDWESAGYINPLRDLLETALYWAQDNKGQVDRDKLLAFIKGYKDKRRVYVSSWKQLLMSVYYNKFAWLRYNVKRALAIECTDNQECIVGSQQVEETLKSIKGYSMQLAKINKWLMNIHREGN